MLEKNNIDKSIMNLTDNQFLYKLDDSLMWLFNTETGEYYDLNEPSYYTLTQFDGKRSIAEIRQLYVQRYLPSGVSQEVLLEDFKNLISHIINTNVVNLKSK